MVVNSVLSAGVQGVKNGIETAENAAQTIARSGTSEAAEPATSNPLPAQQSQNPSESNTLTQALVDLKVAEKQVQASAAVIKTADDVLGTLVDTRA